VRRPAKAADWVRLRPLPPDRDTEVRVKVAGRRGPPPRVREHVVPRVPRSDIMVLACPGSVMHRGARHADDHGNAQGEFWRASALAGRLRRGYNPHQGDSMVELRQNITATIRPGDRAGFVGECLEISVVTEGATVDATIENLREAVALHLEGENPADFGLRERPTLVVTIEVQPSYAKAS
jgi:predicted RNase H-like HicB family nuclease